MNKYQTKVGGHKRLLQLQENIIQLSFSFRALRAKEVKLKPKVDEEKVKPGVEKEDRMTGNLSSKANLSGKASNKQTILNALMVAALFALFA